MAVRAIRGATTVAVDEPTAIKAATVELLQTLFDRNQLVADDIVSILFTATPDLSSVAPAVAAREFGLIDVPLLCAAEMPVDGALPLCIRLILHVETDRARSEVRHVFLRAATALRPDLAEPGDDAPHG